MLKYTNANLLLCIVALAVLFAWWRSSVLDANYANLEWWHDNGRQIERLCFFNDGTYKRAINDLGTVVEYSGTWTPHKKDMLRIETPQSCWLSIMRSEENRLFIVEDPAYYFRTDEVPSFEYVFGSRTYTLERPELLAERLTLFKALP